MNIFRRVIPHAMYIGVMISVIFRDRSHKDEGVVLIVLLACLVGCIAIEFFIQKNKHYLEAFSKDRTWQNLHKLAFRNKSNPLFHPEESLKSIPLNLLWGFSMVYLIGHGSWRFPENQLRAMDYGLAIALIAHIINIMAVGFKSVYPSSESYPPPPTKLFAIVVLSILLINSIVIWVIYSTSLGRTMIGVAFGCLIPASSINLVIFSCKRKFKTEVY